MTTEIGAIEKRMTARMEKVEENLQKKMDELTKELKGCVGDRCTILEQQLAESKKELDEVKGEVKKPTPAPNVEKFDEMKKCFGDECTLIRGELQNTKEMIGAVDEKLKNEEIMRQREEELKRQRFAEIERRRLAEIERKKLAEQQRLAEQQQRTEQQRIEAQKLADEQEHQRIEELNKRRVVRATPPPANECPTCHEAIAEGVTVCPGCGERLLWID